MRASVLVAMALGLAPLMSGCGLVRSKEINAATSTVQLAQFSDRDLCNPRVAETAVVLKERSSRGLGDCTVEHAQCVRTGFLPGTEGYLRCRSSVEQRKAAQAARSAADAERWARVGALGQQMLQPPPVAAPPPPLVCDHYRNQTICR